MSVGYIDTSGGCRAAGEEASEGSEERERGGGGGGVDEVGHMVAHCSLDSKQSLRANQTSAPPPTCRSCALPSLHRGVLLPVQHL